MAITFLHTDLHTTCRKCWLTVPPDGLCYLVWQLRPFVLCVWSVCHMRSALGSHKNN